MFKYYTILLLISPLISAADNPDFSYDNIKEWGVKNPICNNGKSQSPIKLSILTSETNVPDIGDVPPIVFRNYNIQLKNLEMLNNGRTVQIKIPNSEEPPYIEGALLTNKYKAISLHFHWGSVTTRGSEHLIDDLRYDAELHIVHQNMAYDPKEALEKPDGLAVLGFVIKKDIIVPESTGLRKIFADVDRVRYYSSNVTLSSSLALQEIFDTINTSKFFTYQGSLTTPPCSESVSWFVFSKPLMLPLLDFLKLWNIYDENGYAIKNNYRPIQNREGRSVYYRF
ncbi:carbonic anhydrase 6-like [Teleopsis dalmanni]|uniref:carbonic anhydrase 6-like n=1 Tax=Teleopsis dalmanni TaxID=139649 RepID=UPI0018CFB028|nr:carbonic anhydrase 6-like [Teleopsis dalmanni]